MIQDVVKRMEEGGILPVLTLPNPDVSEPLAKALTAGGVRMIEVVLRTDTALESVWRIKRACPDMMVGAGTILSVQTAKEALEAGADYLVSPGFDEEVVDFALENGVTLVPGCVTPTEVQRAVKKGLRVLKFFPADPNGGTDAIELLSGPFSHVKFLPTGEITFENLKKYLSVKSVIACGGSFMATSAQVESGDFEGITAACKKSVEIALGFELAHVGINCAGEKEATETAEQIGKLFGFAPRDLDSAVFAGTAVEAVKGGGFGEKGHIGFSTLSMSRAMGWLRRNGIAIREDGIRRNAAGEITCVVLRDEVAGFALHIVQR